MNQERKATVEEFRGERSLKRLKCSVEATAHAKEEFKVVRARMAEGEPVLFVYIGVPKILLGAMDVLYWDMQQYSALCSAKQMSRYYLDVLNNEGYFRDLCRYCTVPLGYAFDKKPDIAPWGGLPKFAAVIGIHMDDPCMPIWELYAREFGVPMYWIDRAYVDGSGNGDKLADQLWLEYTYGDSYVDPHRLDMMVEEYEGMIRFIETITGKHFSETKLREYMERQNLVSEYQWRATDLSGRTKPCPISWTDALSNVSGIYFPGTEWRVHNAKQYYEEIKDRADKGIGACENEKVRLWWEGHPTWFSLGFYNTWEQSHGTVFLPMYYYAQYLQSNIQRELTHPLRQLARMNARASVMDRIPSVRKHKMLDLAKQWQADGVIWMLVESCKLLYASVLFTREELEKEGVPTLEINADMVDARDWDDTKMKALVTSFIETLMP